MVCVSHLEQSLPLNTDMVNDLSIVMFPIIPFRLMHKIKITREAKHLPTYRRLTLSWDTSQQPEFSTTWPSSATSWLKTQGLSLSIDWIKRGIKSNAMPCTAPVLLSVCRQALRPSSQQTAVGFEPMFVSTCIPQVGDLASRIYKARNGEVLLKSYFKNVNTFTKFHNMVLYTLECNNLDRCMTNVKSPFSCN